MLATCDQFIYVAVGQFGILRNLAEQRRMAEYDDSNHPRRKRRTREHILEDLSENHLERNVLLQGHVLRRPQRDYGVDVIMFHFADDGTIENGEVRFQLKATDGLNVIQQERVISFPIKTGDLHYWGLEIYPFILVVFDAQADVAFWLHVQEYIKLHPESVSPEQVSVNVHIPVSNKLTVESIETFRKLSVQIVTNLRDQGGFPDASRKPR